MKRLATYMMTAAMTLCGTAVTAQTMNSAYFTGDYKYRHDLNPFATSMSAHTATSDMAMW